VLGLSLANENLTPHPSLAISQTGVLQCYSQTQRWVIQKPGRFPPTINSDHLSQPSQSHPDLAFQVSANLFFNHHRWGFRNFLRGVTAELECSTNNGFLSATVACETLVGGWSTLWTARHCRVGLHKPIDTYCWFDEVLRNAPIMTSTQSSSMASRKRVVLDMAKTSKLVNWR